MAEDWDSRQTQERVDRQRTATKKEGTRGAKYGDRLDRMTGPVREPRSGGVGLEAGDNVQEKGANREGVGIEPA